MNREDIEKLLGGYATGTLTPEEQQALFEAALNDQELFDALAREQSLRDLLRDPAARGHLLTALDSQPSRWWGALRTRWRLVTVAAATAGIAGLTVFVTLQNVRPPQPMLVAQVKLPAAPPMEPVATPERRQAPTREVGASQAKATALSPPLTAGTPAPKSGPAPSPPLIAGTPAPKPEPAPSPPLIAATPAPKSEPAPSRPPRAQGGMVGGVLGGVVGGVPAPAAEVFADALSMQDARMLFQAPAGAVRSEKSEAAPKQAGPVRAQRVLATANNIAALPADSVAHLGVRYSVLRKLPGGELVGVEPDQNLAAGDEVELQFQTNDSGYLYVMKGGPGGIWQPLVNRHVERLAQVSIPVVESEPAGRRDYLVLFSRQTQPSLGGAAPQSLVARARDNLTRTVSVQERATYVVDKSSDPASQLVAFTFTLNYQ